jgi:hypothetical protein
MQWKCLPIPKDTNGTPAIHYTTVYKVFARWVDDGSLWQAFIASAGHLAAEKHLDLSILLHGDGANPVAKRVGWDSLLRLQTPEERESHAAVRAYPVAALWHEGDDVHVDQPARVLWYLKLATS